MKRLRYLTLAMLASAVLISTGVHAKRSQNNLTYAPKAHHVIYAVWAKDQSGAIALHGFRVRDVQASGDWTERSVNLETGKTGFLDPAKTEYPNIMKGPQWYKSAAWYRSSPRFLREETIAGVHCFTMSSYNGGGEMSMSLEYGATPFKATIDGVGVEALKVY
jgi:hypothetical protein